MSENEGRTQSWQDGKTDQTKCDHAQVGCQRAEKDVLQCPAPVECGCVDNSLRSNEGERKPREELRADHQSCEEPLRKRHLFKLNNCDPLAGGRGVGNLNDLAHLAGLQGEDGCRTDASTAAPRATHHAQGK